MKPLALHVEMSSVAVVFDVGMINDLDQLLGLLDNSVSEFTDEHGLIDALFPVGNGLIPHSVGLCLRVVVAPALALAVGLGISTVGVADILTDIGFASDLRVEEFLVVLIFFEGCHIRWSPVLLLYQILSYLLYNSIVRYNQLNFWSSMMQTPFPICFLRSQNKKGHALYQ